jgi:Prenyltransferase and squalene oxidase repeat
MTSRKVLDWLLDPEEPSMRYRTLRELLGKAETDSEVRAARARIPEVGWGASILARRAPGGWWDNPDRVYTPKYISTNWMLLVLSDLGLTRDHPAIRASCARWMARSQAKDGGFAMSLGSKSHLCYVGNMTRALLRFGYADHPRVRSALDWLVRAANPRGGWSCWGSGRNLDSWEGLSAFAAYPQDRWNEPMRDAVEKGVEFFLERELYRQGVRYEPWFRFHYPVHYYYDLLVGLDLVTSLGHADDRRLRFALSQLRKKRRPDGRWNLDAIHPDLEGAVAEWYAKHPTRRPIPFGLETRGRPSKMITLVASRVLDRVEGTL